MKTLGVTTSGLKKSKRIRRILALAGWRMTPDRFYRRPDAMAGWGDKPTTADARARAAALDIPYITLEDGFLRSLELGVNAGETCSLVLDHNGAYTNLQAGSDLEALLLADSGLSADQTRRAETLMARLRAERLTKYNPAFDAAAGSLSPNGVLVIDQTLGDASIPGAEADAASFEAMLDAAVAENPDRPIRLKIHPDVIAGKREGVLWPRREQIQARHPRLELITQPLNPWDLIETSAKVYAVSSLLGYEALFAGCETHLFGWPFYSGWGPTQDRAPRPQRLRRRPRSLAALVHASHIRYPLYYDPDHDALCEVERLVDWLVANRAAAPRLEVAAQ